METVVNALEPDSLSNISTSSRVSIAVHRTSKRTDVPSGVDALPSAPHCQAIEALSDERNLTLSK